MECPPPLENSASVASADTCLPEATSQGVGGGCLASALRGCMPSYRLPGLPPPHRVLPGSPCFPSSCDLGSISQADSLISDFKFLIRLAAWEESADRIVLSPEA